MVNYLLIWIGDGVNQPIGTMFEVDRFSTIEQAVNSAKELGFTKYNSIILPYYDITD